MVRDTKADPSPSQCFKSASSFEGNVLFHHRSYRSRERPGEAREVYRPTKTRVSLKYERNRDPASHVRRGRRGRYLTSRRLMMTAMAASSFPSLEADDD